MWAPLHRLGADRAAIGRPACCARPWVAQAAVSRSVRAAMVRTSSAVQSPTTPRNTSSPASSIPHSSATPAAVGRIRQERASCGLRTTVTCPASSRACVCRAMEEAGRSSSAAASLGVTSPRVTASPSTPTRWTSNARDIPRAAAVVRAVSAWYSLRMSPLFASTKQPYASLSQMARGFVQQAVKRQPRCGEVDAMTLTAPVTATGSTLVAVDRHQAGDWQQALASLGRRLPVGWDASGERIGGVAGSDLVLAVPRTLSALAWFLLSAGEDELAAPILQAHHDALIAVAVEFGCAIGAEAPSMVGHAYDSARQPWSHAHLVFGALAATNHGFVPLDPGRAA